MSSSMTFKANIMSASPVASELTACHLQWHQSSQHVISNGIRANIIVIISDLTSCQWHQIWKPPSIWQPQCKENSFKLNWKSCYTHVLVPSKFQMWKASCRFSNLEMLPHTGYSNRWWFHKASAWWFPGLSWDCPVSYHLALVSCLS